MTNNKYVVTNRSASKIVYTIPEEGIRREFAPGESKQIDIDELEKLTYQPGGLVLLARFLQLREPQLTKNFGIHTEPEYFMSIEDVKRLIISGSLDEFLDALDFAPTGVIDLIKKESISLPLTDIQKRKALKDKTGFDVDAALRHIEEDREEDGGKIEPLAPTRRVKPETAAPGRRTTGSKYNVVSRASTESK